MQNNISEDRKKYLRKKFWDKVLIRVTQIAIVIVFIILWETLANMQIIDSFITSKPSQIVKTFMNLSKEGLLEHLGVTSLETIIGFLSGTFLGIIIAVILWWSKFLSKVAEPFLVILNSIPKIALRANNNYLGGCRNASNYSNGTCNFFNSNNTGNIKWIFKYR